MLNRYPLWKYLLVLVVLVVGIIYALPNLYGSDPAIQISATRTTQVDNSTYTQVQNLLLGNQVPVRSMVLDETGLLVRFENVEDQLKSNGLIRDMLGEDYTVALNLASAAPAWLESINAKPMYLGLDLRGGLHFLMEVDTETVMKQAYERYINDLRGLLRSKKVRYLTISQRGEMLELKFRDSENRDQAQRAIRGEFRELVLTDAEEGSTFLLRASLGEPAIREIKKGALQQNVTTLRNRVNELGVAEPVIQQQGDDRIVVQLPGIQDSARAKEILSATAALEFRLVAVEHSVQEALAGKVPVGTRLYKERNGNPILLKKRVIITGDRITNANSGIDQDSASPAVFVNLDGAGAKAMGKTTKENLGKPMAVVFIEHKSETKEINGELVTTTRKVEEVINVATIQGVFSKRFQITGLDNVNESRDLALLLRAGALAAPVRIVEERTIGPSLGQDNIDQGTRSVAIGMLFVIVFMVMWYRGFGLVADTALLVNLILIVAILSMLQATLTLPGIAGIVLTVGMAVDANVLIFSRIREETANGLSPQMAIHSGFERAVATILDANITTLIVAVILYAVGTGPVKGFAVTLSIGILSSLFTAVIVSRLIFDYYLSRSKTTRLSI